VYDPRKRVLTSLEPIPESNIVELDFLGEREVIESRDGVLA